VDPKILIGTLTDRYFECLIMAGIRIELPEGMSAEQFPMGTSLRVVYTLEGDKRIAASIQWSGETAHTPTG
jgi:hypothetical protein